MLGFSIFALWFLVVSVWLLRQWWVSELAQLPSGVAEADQPAPLPITADTLGRGVSVPRPAGWGRVAAPGRQPEPVLPVRLGTLNVAGHSAR